MTAEVHKSNQNYSSFGTRHFVAPLTRTGMTSLVKGDRKHG